MVPAFIDLLFLPFRPFERNTWFLILCITFGLSALLKAIKGPTSDKNDDVDDDDGKKDESASSKRGYLYRVVSSFVNSTYHAVRGFTAGGLDESKIEHHSLSVKLVSTAFVLFVFFVVVAYSGSSAASFVADDGSPRYVIKSQCVFCSVMRTFYAANY